MKALIVFNHPAPYKVRLFNELAKLVDIEVIFERSKAKDRPKEFYNCNEYNFKHQIYTKGYFSNEQSYTNKLKRYIKSNNKEFDLIVMNGYSTITEMKAIKFMMKKKIPYVLFINGGIPANKESAIKKAIKRKYISNAKWYLSPCEEADVYLKYYGADITNVFHYPYSTFLKSELLSKPLDENEKLGIRNKWNIPNSKIFISASQFIERKNNELLIKLFKGRDEKLILLGKGPLEEKYKSIIKEEQIDNVEIRPFLGKKDLFDVMKCSDAFITLSKEDIYGHTTIEALANGLPVISSYNVVSSRHVIKNGLNGYLVNIDNEKEIINAINNTSYSMSKNAIESVQSLTIEETAQAIYNAFTEMTK